MRFGNLVLAALVLLASSPALTRAVPAAGESRTEPLNVVLILADDLGWADLGCYGSTFHRTPHLDALASQGMRFTSAYAASPVCSPTRASILVGKSPARLRLTDWLPGRRDMPSQRLSRPQIITHLPPEEVTLAEALKPAGYASASVGKWHLGGEGSLPERHGFDLNVAGTASGSPANWVSPYRIRTLPDGPAGERLTARLTDEAVNFIERNKDRPFFLYLPHFAVHIPLASRADLIEQYRSRVREGDKHANPVYAALLEELDESVGRVMRKLDELKLADHTLVVFTSDNGGLSVKEGPHTPATSNAPLRAGKGYLYEGGIRVPLIVRWPSAVRPGTTCDAPVISTDLYPTLLDACGMTPATSDRHADGISVLPLLKQSGDLPARELFWHYPHYSNQGGKPGGAVRDGNWKVIEIYEDDRLELYNLKDDLAETKDLAGRMPEKATELRKKLHDWRDAVGAQMMTPNPGYDPNHRPGAGKSRS